MKKTFLLIVVLSFILAFTHSARAALLAYYEWASQASSEGNVSEMQVSPIFYDDDQNTLVSFSNPFNPFDPITFRSDTIGTTHISNSSNFDFDNVANLLTNGLNDKIGSSYIFGGGPMSKSGVVESSKLRAPGDPDTWYLIIPGSTIDYMELTILDFDPTYYSGTNRTIADYKYHVDIYGNPVPIPSALWLLGSGLIGITGIRRKFKK